jgi:hypothetical protein
VSCRLCFFFERNYEENKTREHSGTAVGHTAVFHGGAVHAQMFSACFSAVVKDWRVCLLQVEFRRRVLLHAALE